MFIITVSLIHFFPLIPFPYYCGCSFYWISGVDNGNIGFPWLILILLPFIYWIAEIEPNTVLGVSLLFILLFVVLLIRFPLISFSLSFVVYECFITPLSFIPFLFLPSFYRIRTAFISSLSTTFGSISFILPLLMLILSDRLISPLLILIPLCIKIPPFPSSYRSAEVHCEGNSPIPSLLAGLLSKLGIFGILRSILLDWVLLESLYSVFSSSK